MNDWRTLMQSMYSGGLIGSPNQTAQHLAGPRMLGNNVMPPVPMGGSQGPMGPMSSGNYGGGIAGMIQQYIEQQRAQQGGLPLELPRTQLPRTPGLLGSY